ncbi:MAG: hypothetical protein GY749_39060 [Desulfobacteraceae bacterium]|nr:hypothetical protein [Desulfobacteraceae bacterium]
MFKVGFELELLLLDRNNKQVNKAPLIIEDYRNQGTLMYELSDSMAEVICEPHSDLSELGRMLAKELQLLDRVADDYGVIPVPLSAVCNSSQPFSRDHLQSIGMAKRVMLGDDLRNLEHFICGTHIHIDRNPDENKTLNQFWLMQAVDPLFAFLSSSAIFLGNNSQNNYRVDVCRNQVFKNYPRLGQLSDYPASLDDIYARWDANALIVSNWYKQAGLQEIMNRKSNACWSPVRLREKTIESRSSDTNFLGNVLAQAAMYQAVARLVCTENFVIEIDEHDPGSHFLPVHGLLKIPSLSLLKKYQADAIHQGLKDENLYGYIKNVLSTLKPYMSDEGAGLFEMYYRRQTLSDEIVRFSIDNGFGIGSKVLPHQSSEVYAYVRERYVQDLRNFL